MEGQGIVNTSGSGTGLKKAKEATQPPSQVEPQNPTPSINPHRRPKLRELTEALLRRGPWCSKNRST